MKIEIIGNQVEAVIWFIVAVVLFVRSFSAPAQYKLITYLASLAFLAFGISDIIETYTGGWWKPWWLLVLKGTCIVIFIVCLLRYYKLKKAGMN